MISDVNNTINQGTLVPDPQSDVKSTITNRIDSLSEGVSDFAKFFNLLNLLPDSQDPTKLDTLASPESPLNDITNEIASGALGETSINDFLNDGLLTSDITSLQNTLAEALTSSIMNQLIPSSVTSTNEMASNPTQSDIQNSNILNSLQDLTSTNSGLELNSAVNPLNNISTATSLVPDTTFTDVSIVSSLSLAGSYLASGPAGLIYTAADIVTSKLTGESIVGNLYEFGKDIFED